jgi:two-component system, sensor histidine kinase LadS
MKHRYVIFLFLSVHFLLRANAQPIPICLDATRNTYPIGTQVDYLADSTGTLTLAEVQRSTRFTRSQKSIPSFGFSEAVYWFRFQVRTTDPTRQWLFELGYSHFRTADLYLTDSVGRVINTTLAGNSRGAQHRPLPTHNYVFPLPLAAGQAVTVYLRADGMASKLFPLTVYEQHTFYEKAQQTSLWLGFYFGFITITLLYHFVVFLYNQRQQQSHNYLFFSAYLLAYLLNELIRGNGNYVERLVLVQYPFWQQHVVALLNGIIVLVSLSGLRFYSVGLQLRQAGRWHRTLMGLSWANVLLYSLLLTGLFPTAWSLVFNFMVPLVAYLAVLLASLSRLADGYRPAGYYVAATLVLLAGVITVLAERAGWLPDTNFWQHNAIQVASIIEIVLLTLGFAGGIRAEHRRRKLDLELADLAGRKTEREWLSVLLHTSFGTTLSAMLFELSLLDWKAIGTSNRDRLERLGSQLREALAEARFLSHSLPPTLLDERGLQAGFESLIQNFNKQKRVRFSLETSGLPYRFDSRHEFELYLVGLELLNNVMHHAGATEATLSLRWQPAQQLLLQLHDNGRGFGEAAPGGYGLSSIRRIVEQKLGGSVGVSNAPTGGALIRIQVSLPAATTGEMPTAPDVAATRTPIRRLFGAVRS